MSNCKVLHDYDAKNPDELSLKVGEIISGVNVAEEGGWWEGLHPSGVKGWFPDNFVEKIPDKAKPPPPKAAPVSQPPAPAKKQCKCTFEYQAQNEDELSLKIGDIIDIISQEEEGWWEGSFNGKSGMFPNNFVEEIASTAAPPVTAKASNSDAEEDDAVKAKKVEKVGFGNIFGGGGMPVLRKTGTFSNKEKPDFVKKVAATKPPPPKAAAPPAAKMDIVKVEFDYVRGNPDELSMTKGDFLNVLKRDTEGWWEGHLINDPSAKGWFPDNFVAEASDSEKAEFEPKKAPAPAPAPSPAPAPVPEKKEAVKPPAVVKPPPPVVKSPPPAEKKPPPVVTKAAPPPAKKPAAKKPPPMVAKKSVPAPVQAPTVVNDGEAKKAAEAAMTTAKEAMALAQSLEKIVHEQTAAMAALKTTMTEGLDKVKNAVKMLTSDVDEESAGRAKMQIELDRLKKLVQL